MIKVGFCLGILMFCHISIQTNILLPWTQACLNFKIWILAIEHCLDIEDVLKFLKSQGLARARRPHLASYFQVQGSKMFVCLEIWQKHQYFLKKMYLYQVIQNSKGMKFKPWFGHHRWLSRCWWCQAKRPRPLRPRDAKWLQCAGFWSNSDSSTRKIVAVAF